MTAELLRQQMMDLRKNSRSDNSIIFAYGNRVALLFYQGENITQGYLWIVEDESVVPPAITFDRNDHIRWLAENKRGAEITVEDIGLSEKATATLLNTLLYPKHDIN